jgi:hypothetical protein
VIDDSLIPESPQSSIVCTEAGIQIDFNDEQPESASAPIRVSFEPDSKVNDESNLQQEKERSERITTEAGRQIDLNEA